MDEEKDVEHQLDDLFNGDFIEIDGNGAYGIIENQEINDSLKSKSNISYVDSIKEEPKKKEVKINIENNNLFEDSNNQINDTAIENKVEDSNNQINDTAIENKVEDKKIKPIKNKININKKIIIFSGLFFITILIILLISSLKEKNYVCNLNIGDVGYQINDKYEIMVKNGYIKQIINNYSYEYLNDSFKDQIEAIKKEKMPVIINSNGMPGFTYIFEEENNKFSVSAYLDFNEFKNLDKINQTEKPIAFFKIKNKMKYKKFKKELMEKGYTCK